MRQLYMKKTEMMLGRIERDGIRGRPQVNLVNEVDENQRGRESL